MNPAEPFAELDPYVCNTCGVRYMARDGDSPCPVCLFREEYRIFCEGMRGIFREIIEKEILPQLGVEDGEIIFTDDGTDYCSICGKEEPMGVCTDCADNILPPPNEGEHP